MCRQTKHGDKTKRKAPRGKQYREGREFPAQPGIWAASIVKKGKKTPAIFWTKKWSLRLRVCSSKSLELLCTTQTRQKLSKTVAEPHTMEGLFVTKCIFYHGCTHFAKQKG